jgi:hypothetical protein
MCLLCIEIAKGNMTYGEYIRARREFVGTTNEERDHLKDLDRMTIDQFASDGIDELMKPKESKRP